MKREQWTALPDGVGYVLTGETVPVLPPGMYDLMIAPGQLIWSPVDTRTDDLVRFPDTPGDRVLAEVEDFWRRGAEFAAHGLPYKRGILLYGPPGSGKTCTLRQIAEDVVQRGGYVLALQKVEVLLLGMRQLREAHPEAPVVVLMEDLEGLMGDNPSALLNLLDGIERVERVVFLATTNYPERLGPHVLNRPSRFDRRIRLPQPDPTARRLYLETLALPDDGADLDRMVADSQGLSLAHLKELFVATTILRADYAETLAALRAMSERVSSHQFDDEDLGLGGQYM